MIEAGAPSTEEVVAAPCCARPTGYSHGRTIGDLTQRFKGASEGRAGEGCPKSAAKGIIEAGIIHLASLQRGSLTLREVCYNVVT
jgi:hypothetical protein